MYAIHKIPKHLLILVVTFSTYRLKSVLHISVPTIKNFEEIMFSLNFSFNEHVDKRNVKIKFFPNKLR